MVTGVADYQKGWVWWLHGLAEDKQCCASYMLKTTKVLWWLQRKVEDH